MTILDTRIPADERRSARMMLRLEQIASAFSDAADGTLTLTSRLIIENRTDDPASPVTGQIWLRTDI